MSLCRLTDPIEANSLVIQPNRGEMQRFINRRAKCILLNERLTVHPKAMTTMGSLSDEQGLTWLISFVGGRSVVQYCIDGSTPLKNVH